MNYAVLGVIIGMSILTIIAVHGSNPDRYYQKIYEEHYLKFMQLSCPDILKIIQAKNDLSIIAESAFIDKNCVLADITSNDSIK